MKDGLGSHRIASVTVFGYLGKESMPKLAIVVHSVVLSPEACLLPSTPCDECAQIMSQVDFPNCTACTLLLS